MTRYGMGISMRDIAAEADVSRGSLYRYFGDRATLVDAVLDHTADRFLAAMANRVDRGRTLADQVAEAISFMAARSHQLTRAAASLRRADSRVTPFDALLVIRTGSLAQRWLAFWLPRLDQAATRGEIRADVDTWRAAEWLVRVLLSFALLPDLVVDPDDRAVLRRFVADGLLQGIGT